MLATNFSSDRNHMGAMWSRLAVFLEVHAEGEEKYFYPQVLKLGKGNPEGWVAVVKPGRVLFEVEGVTEDLAKKALGLAAAKLPVKTRFVKREES